MRRAVLVGSVLLAACGGSGEPAADFHGTFVGTLNKKATCSDGSTPTGSNEKHVTIVQSGSSADIDPGDCPGVHGTISGNELRFTKEVVCPEMHQGDGSTFRLTLKAGKMVLSGADIAVELTVSDVTVRGGASVSCDASITGTLTRQP